MLEVELKASLEGFSPEILVERIRSIGFHHQRTLREIDLYFNAYDRDFHQTDEALRLRRCQSLPKGTEEVLITYKGPKQGSMAKSRKEYETSVGELEIMERLLEALGYHSLAPVEKIREEYTLENTTLCLDTVYGLGYFLELEQLVEMEQERDAAVTVLLSLLESLGIPQANLTRSSYLEMLLASSKDK